MKLDEKHKEFSVKCYARFMTRTEVVEAFIEEFADDLSSPLTMEECFLDDEEELDDERTGCENLSTADNVLKELETPHGSVKRCLFEETQPKEAMKYVNLSHQILKTIVAHNAVSGKQEVVDITPRK